jgi:NAD(P)H-nitrite reductase large subunit
LVGQVKIYKVCKACIISKIWKIWKRLPSTRYQKAVVVGGGLIGIEMAEMFHSRHIPVTFWSEKRVFGMSYLPPEESAMINQHIHSHGIDLRLSEELLEIKGSDGKVSSIMCKNSGEEIACEFVGLTVGVSPNVDVCKIFGHQYQSEVSLWMNISKHPQKMCMHWVIVQNYPIPILAEDL